MPDLRAQLHPQPPRRHLTISLAGFALALSLGACTASAGAGDTAVVRAALGSLTISGQVRTSAGPVSGATVSLTGSDHRTVFSDATGRYAITSLGAGSYQLSAAAGATCTSGTAVNINALAASATVDLGLTGSGCGSITVVT